MGSAHDDGLYYAQELRRRCHCGKDGHAINSINCPVHGRENDREGLLAEIERLRGALFGLLDKILEIEAHPAFSAVFSMAAVHGCPYTGPNYVAELDVARSLRAADEKKSDT